MDEIENYVRQAAALQAMQLDADALQRVAVVLARNAQLADLLMTFDLGETTESAPVFQAQL